MITIKIKCACIKGGSFFINLENPVHVYCPGNLYKFVLMFTRSIVVLRTIFFYDYNYVELRREIVQNI